MNAVKPIALSSVEEFYAMPKEEGWNYELVDGFVMMSPSPSREHQTIAGNLHFVLRTKLNGTRCEALFELDVWRYRISCPGQTV